jgi:hypothetical protein
MKELLLGKRLLEHTSYITDTSCDVLDPMFASYMYLPFITISVTIFICLYFLLKQYNAMK